MISFKNKKVGALTLERFFEQISCFQKHKILAVLLSIFLLFLSTQFTNASSRATLNKYELAVLSAFENKCDNFEATASLFPDAFLDNYVQASCELAALYNPKKFALKNALLTAAKSFVSGGVYKLDGDHSFNERLKHYNVKINKNVAYDQKEHQKTLLNLALAGDPASINMITYNQEVMPIRGGRGLNKAEVSRVAKYIGQDAANFLFLNNQDLDDVYKNYDDLLNASNNILKQADRLSNWYLDLIVSRVVSSTLNVDPYNKFFQIEALIIPHELRLNLMRLNTLTNEVPVPLMEAFWLIEFSTHEANTFFNFGTNSSFIDIRFANLQNNTLSCAIQLRDSLAGLSSHFEASALIDCLQKNNKADSATVTEIFQYIPELKLDFVLNFDLDSYYSWVENKAQKITQQADSFNAILAADMRYILREGGEFGGFKNLENLQKLYKSDTKRFEVIATQNLSDLVKLTLPKSFWPKRAFNNNEINIFSAVAKLPNQACGRLSSTVCKKAWRSIEMEPTFRQIIKVEYPSFTKPQKECTIPTGSAGVIKTRIWAGRFSRRISDNCTAEKITKIFDIKPSELNYLVAKSGALPSPGNGIAFSTNADLFVHKNFAQVIYHFHSSTPDRSASVLPHQGINYTLASDPSLAMLNKELLLSNPMALVAASSQNKGEFDNDYWNEQQPFTGLAEAFGYQGANELAMLASMTALDKLFDPEIYDRTAALLKLSDVVIFARKALIPERFIRAFNVKQLAKIDLIFGKSANSLDSLDENSIFQASVVGWWKNEVPKTLTKVITNANIVEAKRDFKSHDKNKFLNIFGVLISSNYKAISSYCTEESDIRFLHSIFDDTGLSKELGRYILTPNIYGEWVRFISECRLSVAKNVELSPAMKEITYDRLMKYEIKQFLDNGGNPVHPTFFAFYDELSLASKYQKSVFGTAVSLVVLKHNLSFLLDAFLTRDSRALRLNQTKIERILVNSLGVIVDGEAWSNQSPSLRSELIMMFASMAGNYHFPILSNKTRERFLLGGEKITKQQVSPYELTAFKQLADHFKKNDKVLATTNDPFEFVASQANKANHQIHLIYNGYLIANQLNAAVTNIATSGITENQIIINLMRGYDGIAIQLASPAFGFSNEFVELDGREIDSIIETISGERNITPELFGRACEAFSPLHRTFEYFAEKLGNSAEIAIVPSVNLLPIPSEIILGNVCREKDLAIVHAGDTLAALELLTTAQQGETLDHLVAVGSPIAQTAGFSINTGVEVVMRGTGSVSTFVLDEMPPLADAVVEIESISSLFDNSKSFVKTNGSINNALKSVVENNLAGNVSAIVLATHGLAVDYEGGVTLPALLSSDNGKLSLFTSSNLKEFKLEGSIVILSACDTAAGFVDREDLYYTGFVEGFADTGADFITASLWPVVSAASRNTTEAFFKTMKKSSDFFKSSLMAKKAPMVGLDALPFVFIYP